MFNLGFTELLVLAVIGLLVLGPEQLPQVARKLARILNELKRATEDAMTPVNEMKDQFTEHLEQTREQLDNESKKIQQSLDQTQKEIQEKIEGDKDGK